MYDIQTLKRKMLVKYPFFGSVISNIEYKELSEIETAATDGEKIYFNPNYLNRLTTEEQIFTLSHEVCHIAFNHILRSEGKNPKIWNIATDAVINQFLKRDGLPLPNGVIDIPDAIKYDAEELYNELLKRQSKNNENSNSDGSNNNSTNSNSSNNSSSSNSQDNKESQNNENNSNSNGNENEENKTDKKPGDSHDMWKDAIKKLKEKNDENKSDNKEQNKTNDKNEEKVSEKEAFNKNREEKKKKLEDLKEKISEAAAKAGNSTNSDKLKFESIGRAKPIVDWRYVLRETTKYDVDYSYKNATIENGVLAVGIEEIPVPETEILLDTSGSINETLLKNFLKECKNILCYSKISVGCFDTKFYGFKRIRREEDIDYMEFIGRGGTDFDAAVNAFTRRVDNKIIFTDGEASMPTKEINAIWMVFGGRRIKPKGGKVIYISDEDYRKLCYLKSDKPLVKSK